MLRTLQGMPTQEEAFESNRDGFTLEVDDLINRVAQERNENRFVVPAGALTKVVKEELGFAFDGRYTLNAERQNAKEPVVAETQALCWPGYAGCSVGTFQETGLTYNFCSNGNCRIGFVDDRVSNEACELLACDYRITYPTDTWRATRVEGLTAAANCVVTAWPTLLNSYDAPWTRILYGYGHTTQCGVLSGSYLKNNTRAWKP
ncbi:MAG: hypothetical protein RLZZ324_251 [Candidatus Parcubacteria bacterium]|jgi:hypothetical protein